MIIIAKYTILFFGLFFVFIGFLMLFNPKKARATLRKVGSTNFYKLCRNNHKNDTSDSINYIC